MPYVHLANGDVVHHTDKELAQVFGDSGHQRAYRQNGVEHTVIGVYPDEVEYQQTDDEKADAEDRREFEEYKRNRDERAEV